MTADPVLFDLINRLNLLRLQRRQLAIEEATVYRQLRTIVFGNQGGLVPEFFKSEEEQVSDDLSNNVEGVLETAAIEADEEVILSDIELGVGARVYISNKITHFKETDGESKSHRLGTVTKVNNLNGRVYLDTDSGHRVWRKRKNLRLVLKR